MLVIYPEEITKLRKSIPEKYFAHPEKAPKEYRERFELWKQKSIAYDEYVRQILWGF